MTPPRFSGSFWLLIVGLFLFDIGCLCDPNLLDQTMRRLDFRLWPSWWFLVIALILVGLSAKKWCRRILVVTLALFFASGPIFAAEKKIVELEPPKRISEKEIRKSSQAESEKNDDGGYNANANVVDSFAAMEYRFYTGGRYENEPIRFRLLSPDRIQPDKKYSMLVCFHGKGESGNDNTRQLAHLQSTIEFLARKNKLDLFVLVTQCPEDNPYWDVSVSNEGKGDAPLTILDEIYDTVLKEYPIDRDKLYVYGHCSGGNAAWKFADSHPNRIAAMIVCSASPGRAAPEHFLKTAIWAFHNKDDETPPGPTETIIDDINALGGNAFLTLNEKGGHDSWTNALGKDKAVGWLAYQTLGKTGPPQGVKCYHRSAGSLFFMFGLPILLIAGTLACRFLGVRKQI